jgi:hypothetical protein
MSYDWSYENSILQTKQYSEPNLKEQYSKYRTNTVLSNYVDTVLYANEMNMFPFIDDKMHYDYLFNSIRPKKRFFKRKKQVNHSNISLISEYYKYNRKKTLEASKILTENQIKTIKEKLEKGGIP